MKLRPTMQRLALLGIAAALAVAAVVWWQARGQRQAWFAGQLEAAEKAAAGPAGPVTNAACQKITDTLRAAVDAIAGDDDRAVDAGRGYRVLAQCAMHLGRVDDAVADFRRAIGRRAEYAPLHGDLAMALVRQGQHRAAQRSAQLGVQLDPDVWVAHRQYARVLEAGGNVPAAQRAYERALQIAPAEQIQRLQDEINRFRQRHELRELEATLASPDGKEGPLR